MSRRWSSLAVGLVAAAVAACSSRPPVSQNSPPPVVTFEAPADGSYLHGSVAVSAKAVGTGKITSFKFDAPAALATTAATMDAAARTATLTPNLDLSVFPDGPLTVSVTAKDEFGGSTSKTMTINVASKAPTISIGSPAGSTVAGAAVAVTATANAQGGASITKLELIAGPAGMGANTSAAAALFAASWDSTKAPEGPVVLHFRATDSTGLVGDTSITVTVDNVPFGKLDTFVFAGAPVKDAHIEVWAISDATGAVDTAAGVSGLLGTGGPTDAGGHVLVTLTAENYSGPIQVKAVPASGTTLQYVDPADPGQGFVQIPTSLILTSIIPAYTTGQAITAPVTLTTTLADAEVLAYAGGKHRLHAGGRTVTQAAAYGDGLFTQHVQSSTPRWMLRSTAPVDLAAAPTTLTDRAYAAFTDIALNQLAKDLGAQIRVTGVITAPFLVSKLMEDLAADGQFDGKGAGGAAITTQTGSPPYAFDENTMRVKLANALDTWVQSGRNVSTLDRASLAGAGVFTTISGDTSELFGPAAPVAFDNAAPTVNVTITYGPTNAPPYAGTYVAGNVKIVIVATDPSGVKALSAKLGTTILDSGASVVPSADGLSLTYTVVVNSTLMTDMSYTLSITATDQRSNTATSTPATLTIDNTAPVIAVVTPTGGYYGSSIPLEATASDLNGVASLTETAQGVVPPIPSATHFVASWSIPVAAPDGAVTFTYKACDVVGNCSTTNAVGNVDRTAPMITLASTVPAYTGAGTINIVVNAADGGSGVAGVTASGAGLTTGAPGVVPGTWNLNGVTLNPGVNTITIWGVDKASPANGSAATGIAVKVIRDNLAPARVYAQGLSGFTSEQGLTARTNPDGTAMFPGSYALASGAATGFLSGGTVYRSAARVGAVPSSASELESVALNVNNIPAIQYRVSYNPATDAPLSAVSAAVTVADGVNTTTVSGLSLLPTSSIDPNAVAYDLPLTSATIPALATVAANASVTVVLTMTDAAGNTATDVGSAFNFIWSLLAPPLVVRQDTLWADGRDPSSAYGYPATNSAYFSTWNSTLAAFVGGNVRIARYIVENPSGAGAAVVASATVTSSVRGFSSPLDIGPTAVNGVGSPTNPGVYPGVAMPADPTYYTSGPAGAYWTTSMVPGCTGATQVDPTCDPTVVGYCPMVWAASPAAACGPGAAMLPNARVITRAATDVVSHVTDGFTFYRNWGYWVAWTGPNTTGRDQDGGSAVCTPGAAFGKPQANPTLTCPAGQVIRHVLGDTTNQFSLCQRADYFSAPSAVAHEYASATAGVSAWSNVQPNGAERSTAINVGGSSYVPPASALGPGQIVIYVARPASAPAPANLSFGGVTGALRLEQLIAYWWQDPGAVNLRFLYWRNSVSNPWYQWCDNRVLQERQELAAFARMEEVLDGSLVMTGRPATTTALLGASVPVASFTFTKTAVGSR